MADPRSKAGGPAVTVGVSVPQANPTVEWELRQLLPGDVLAVVTRATSRREGSADRLVEYFESLPDQLASFDSLRLSSFGLACTASSYLVGAETEERVLDRLSERAGFPVTTASRAILEELHLLGAESVALYSPYPPELAEAAEVYWTSLGLKVVSIDGALLGDDTRAIYDLDGDVALRALEAFRGPADVLLFSGTGLPTLAALREALRESVAGSRLALSSNLCLVASLLRSARYLAPTTPATTLLMETAST